MTTEVIRTFIVTDVLMVSLLNSPSRIRKDPLANSRSDSAELNTAQPRTEIPNSAGVSSRDSSQVLAIPTARLMYWLIETQRMDRRISGTRPDLVQLPSNFQMYLAHVSRIHQHGCEANARAARELEMTARRILLCLTRPPTLCD